MYMGGDPVGRYEATGCGVEVDPMRVVVDVEVIGLVVMEWLMIRVDDVVPGGNPEAPDELPTVCHAVSVRSLGRCWETLEIR